MAKGLKIVQCDKRGQIVIPKSIRASLGLDDGSAFWIYSNKEGIILKKIISPSEGSLKKTMKKIK